MAVLGAFGVGVIGLAIMLAIVVAKSRVGYFTFSLDDLVAVRWETLPVLAGLVVGGVLGYRRPLTLDRAALRGFLALAPGIVAGAMAGRLLWGAGEGSWSGGIIGGALALVAGALSVFRLARPETWPLRSGLAGAASLLSLGTLGAIGVAGARDLTPIEFEPVEAAALPAPSEVDAVAFLVGDAGDATVETSPLLHALKADVEHWSAALARDSATSVLFLGDLVYPAGVHDRDHPRFPEDSTRLWDQVWLVGGEAARRHATIGLFTTGNHDWGNTTGDAGMDRVRNLEEQFGLARESGHRVALLPAGGTPGPAVRDLRNNVRILFLDTHWFLQQRSSAEHALFFARLRAALEGAGDREVIVVAHHPFTTAGPHGVTIPGYHSGGIEYLLKRSGSLVQDLNSPVYADLLAGLVRAFAAAPRPPLVFAGGHDHSLQVFKGVGPGDPRFSLVSGAGSKISALSASERLAWGGSRPGYMMLVFRKDDGVDLFVVAGDPDYLACRGPRASDVTCMLPGTNAFDVVYSASLLGPSGRDQPIPEADVDTLATPWFREPPPSDSAGLAVEPAAVSPRLLAAARDSVITLPGRTYEAGGIRRFLLGDLNRHLWRTPVSLPVLRVDSVAGGLTPVELTGGFQTIGLRLRDRTGMEYEFRPIVKSVRLLLPGWMREGVIGDLLDDQMASQFPFAALVVDELVRSAGMMAPELAAVVMADDEHLGEFRDRFAGRLGMFGPAINERADETAGFGGYREIVDTEVMLTALDTDPDVRVDAGTYLRLRLIDMLTGDWDRHPGQWRWARHAQGDSATWIPIAQDRDWAFARLDGALSFIPRLFFPRYVGFSSAFPDVSRLVAVAKELDVRLLNEMKHEDFMRAAREVQATFTDSVIDAAVATLPAGLDVVEGQELRTRLEVRRDNLHSVAADYHSLISAANRRVSFRTPDPESDARNRQAHNAPARWAPVRRSTRTSSRASFHRGNRRLHPAARSIRTRTSR